MLQTHVTPRRMIESMRDLAWRYVFCQGESSRKSGSVLVYFSHCMYLHIWWIISSTIVEITMSWYLNALFSWWKFLTKLLLIINCTIYCMINSDVSYRQVHTTELNKMKHMNNFITKPRLNSGNDADKVRSFWIIYSRAIHNF